MAEGILEPPMCPECTAPMVLRDSRHGPFYGCSTFPKCRGTHGAHPDGRPLGTPGDKATKRARILAHDAFDTLWRGEHPAMTRPQAYKWLTETLSIKRSECHIGLFSEEQCQKVIDAVKRRRGDG